MNTTESDAKTKRPASHKWALLVFFLVAATNIWLSIFGLYDVLGVIVTIAGVAAFFASFLFPRARQTYTVGIITLILVNLRSVQSFWYAIAAYRDRVWHMPRPAQPFLLAFDCAGVFLLFLLLWAYTFGAASRLYYGLPPTPNDRIA